MKFSVNNGSFRYKNGEREVLKDISLEAYSGDVLAVLGPNGAGKTTLLRCALNFLRFSSGNAFLDDKPVSEYGHKELWRRIAYVPQAKQSVSPYSVEETVLLGRNSYSDAFGKIGRNDYEKADEIIERLNLSGIRNKSCREISGGELQMVLVARALAAEPELLVLDEPESNLDFKNQLIVLDTLSKLAREGKGIILNTHYPAHALRRANKALLLGRDGSFEFGRSEEIITESNIKRFFGVNAVIGSVESKYSLYPDVVPVDFDIEEKPSYDGRALATFSIIMPDTSAAAAVNRALHKLAPYVEGRMGMPCKDAGLYIINLVVNAPINEINAAANELSRLDGVSVKITFAKGA